MVLPVEVAKPKSTHETDPLKDAGIVGDIRDLCQSQNALDATLNTIGVAAGVVDAAVNPIKTAVSTAVSWIISHIDPLPDMLQQFTGDPEKVEAAALTWERIGTQWTQAADELESAFSALLDGQVCRTLNAYKVQITSVIETFRAMGEACGVVAVCLNILSAMVKIVYDLTREAIGDLIGSFIQSATEIVCSLGLATPVVVGQISATVSKWVARITTKGKQVLNGFQEALRSFKKLNGILEKFGHALKKLFSNMSGASDKVRDAWRAGKNKIDDLADYIPDGVKDAWRAGKNKLDDLADDVADGAKDAWRAGKNKLDDLADDVADGAKDAWKAAKNKADDLADHIPDGMKDAGKKAAQRAHDVAVQKPIDLMKAPSNAADKWGKKVAGFLYRDGSPEQIAQVNKILAKEGLFDLPLRQQRELL